MFSFNLKPSTNITHILTQQICYLKHILLYKFVKIRCCAVVTKFNIINNDGEQPVWFWDTTTLKEILRTEYSGFVAHSSHRVTTD